MSGFTVKIETTDEILDDVKLVMDDSLINMALDAVADTFGWTETMEVSKARFFTQQMRRWVFEIVKTQQVKLAMAAAQKSAVDQVNAMEQTLVVQ